MAGIRLSGVTKEFAQAARLGRGSMPVVAALQDVDLAISDRELFTFVGPSGCGKSTALGLIAGLEQPTTGRIFFDDIDVTELEPRARDVAMVFQSYALYPHMTVFENISFPLRIRKLSKARITKDVEEVAESLGLSALLGRRPKELSGGQRQRVALARALVRRPRVFLLDEPLSNLDARLRLEMRSEIRRICRRWEVTTIYVTHDQEEAMVLSDRVAVMKDGKVEQCAPPLEIYHRPQTKFVAEFVGSPPMQFIPVRALSGELAAALGVVTKAHAADDVLVGVRPAALSFGDSAQRSVLAEHAVVQAVEQTGAEAWVEVLWGEVVLKVRETPGAEPAVGSEVRVFVAKDALHLFSAASGKRINGAN